MQGQLAHEEGVAGDHRRGLGRRPGRGCRRPGARRRPSGRVRCRSSRRVPGQRRSWSRISAKPVGVVADVGPVGDDDHQRLVPQVLGQVCRAARSDGRSARCTSSSDQHQAAGGAGPGRDRRAAPPRTARSGLSRDRCRRSRRTTHCRRAEPRSGAMARRGGRRAARTRGPPRSRCRARQAGSDGVDEVGLADAGIARHQHQPGGTGERLLDPRGEGAVLALSAGGVHDRRVPRRTMSMSFG